MNIIAFLIATMLVFSGCEKKINVEQTIAEPELVQIQADEKDFIGLYREKDDYNLSMLEPAQGCILGGYIVGDRSINGSIDKFESLTSKQHGIYSYNMVMGEKFPLSWILECYINEAIPSIVVRPPKIENPFDIDSITELANDFGRLNIPMFIQFYPNPGAYDFDTQEYINLFNKARDIFRQKAPNVAFIWSVDLENIESQMKYYPDESTVDWVGTSIYVPVEKLSQDFYSKLDYFYFMFQGKKPMMISSLGISHFSTDGHKYEIKKSADLIKSIYTKLENEYPLIKAVIYSDYSNVDKSPYKAIREDYTITSERSVLEAYSTVTKSDYFLSQFETGEKSNCLLKSPYKSCMIGDKLYVSTLTFEYFLKEATDGSKVLINNEEYIEIDSNNIYEIQDKYVIYKG